MLLSAPNTQRLFFYTHYLHEVTQCKKKNKKNPLYIPPKKTLFKKSNSVFTNILHFFSLCLDNISKTRIALAGSSSCQRQIIPGRAVFPIHSFICVGLPQINDLLPQIDFFLFLTLAVGRRPSPMHVADGGKVLHMFPALPVSVPLSPRTNGYIYF